MVSSLDVRMIVLVLRKSIGARFKNCYQERDTLLIQLNKDGTHTYTITPTAFYEKEKTESAGNPPPFAQLIRKYLDGLKLSAVEQPGTERIVSFLFSNEKRKSILVVEFVPPGNVLLLDENAVILGARVERSWKGRTIARGEKYIPPPALNAVLSLSLDEFSELLSRDSNTERSLAVTCGLGGDVAKLVMKHSFSNAPHDVLESFQRVWNPEHPVLPVPPEKGVVVDEKKEKLIADLRRRIAVQEERRKQLEEDALIATRAGELIYENYQNVKEALGKHKQKFTMKLG